MARHYERVASVAPTHSFGGEGLNTRHDSKQRARKVIADLSVAEHEVVDSRIADCQAEVERLRAEVARLTEENRAFVSSVRHMTSAAEEVLAEARREAAETRARTAAEAYERLVVARADARAAVHEERQRTAAELELLAAVRERIQAERSTLSNFQDELSGRLRDLVSAVFDFEENTPSLTAGPSWDPTIGAGPSQTTTTDSPSGTAPNAATSPDADAAPTYERASVPTVPAAPPADAPDRYVDTVVVEDTDSATLIVDPGDEAEEELEAAFAAFFHADIEGEPSRHWILDGR